METTHQIPQANPEKAFAAAKLPLFSPTQIAVGAFFGTLVASGWLARTNLLALGDKKRGDRALLLGVVVTMAMMALAFVMPENVPGAVFTVPQIVVALQLAQREFGARMQSAEHVSNWTVAAVCLVSIVLVVFSVIGVGVALYALGLVEL